MVGQFFDFAHTVHQDDFFETLVSVGVTHDAEERGQARARANEVEVFGGQQIIDQQSASGLFADHDFVAHLDVL